MLTSRTLILTSTLTSRTPSIAASNTGFCARAEIDTVMIQGLENVVLESADHDLDLNLDSGLGLKNTLDSRLEY